jgi:hypothetical protein
LVRTDISPGSRGPRPDDSGRYNKRVDDFCEENLQAVIKHEWSSDLGKQVLLSKIAVSAGKSPDVNIPGWPQACAVLTDIVKNPSRSNDLRLWEEDLRRVERHLCMPPEYDVGDPQGSTASRSSFLNSLSRRIFEYCVQPRYGGREYDEAITVFKQEYLPKGLARDLHGEEMYENRNQDGQGHDLGLVGAGELQAAAVAPQGDRGHGADAAGAVDELASSLQQACATCAAVASARIGDALQSIILLAEMPDSDSDAESESAAGPGPRVAVFPDPEDESRNNDEVASLVEAAEQRARTMLAKYQGRADERGADML